MRVPRLVQACAALALAVGIAAAPASATAAPTDPQSVDVTVTVPFGDLNAPSGGTAVSNAQLRWALNAESGAGAFAGGCNFLSAGAAGDAGGARVWTEGDGLYRASEGAVRIEKPTASGGWTTATWADKCRDAQGETVTVASTTSTSGNQVVIDGGTGTRRDGALEIRWKGSFTVVFYGGMTYWTVTDPVLLLDAAGDGQLTGTASGYATSMDDMTRWQPIPGRSVVLAEIRGAGTSSAAGFAVTPEYLGISVSGSGQVARTTANAAYWGSFPQSFVDFHRLTGQQGYWLTTGGVRDAAKPASPVYVSYDASTPVAVGPPASDGASAAATANNPVRTAPAVAAVSAEAVPPLAFAATTPLTTQPQREGLVPGLAQALSPLVPPLLGAAAALSVAIVAVLSMMQALPWQRAVV